MVGNRVTYMAESRGWWCDEQAGFRRLRSAEDQVLNISQSVLDGFQKKPAERTVMALLDFSRAYDTVWRADLMNVLLRRGGPVPVHSVDRGIPTQQAS